MRLYSTEGSMDKDDLDRFQHEYRCRLRLYQPPVEKGMSRAEVWFWCFLSFLCGCMLTAIVALIAGVQ